MTNHVFDGAERKFKQEDKGGNCIQLNQKDVQLSIWCFSFQTVVCGVWGSGHCLILFQVCDTSLCTVAGIL